jgi:hypothetical protein
MKSKKTGKIVKLQQNAEEIKGDFGKTTNEELVQFEEIKDTPFQVVTEHGMSWGALGNYRLTEPNENKIKVRDELKKISWNRIIQVIMILDEIKEKVNINKLKKDK